MRTYFAFLNGIAHSELVAPCDSLVYCHGDLLDTVQKLDMFEESKYFVDMGLKHSEEDVIAKFKNLSDVEKSNTTFMKSWVDDNFFEPGFEFEQVEFEIVDDPAFLSQVSDVDYRQWAHDLYKIWPLLGRQVKKTVQENTDLTSFIPIEHHTVVPTGPDGRFRESYYWDTFWTLRGMLECGLVADVHDILLNFKDLITKFGFIPNGTRRYYTKRSQPPLFTMMVEDLIKYLPDDQKVIVLAEFLQSLTDEFTWWENNRSVTVDGQKLFRYASEVNTNRPEAYMADEEVLSSVPEEQREILAAHITSAAESGWDFSYRWTGEANIESSAVLASLRTRDIVPVDLNFLMAYNAKKLSEMIERLSGGPTEESQKYEEKFLSIISAIDSTLFDDSRKCYFDFDISKNQLNKQFFASNYVPLFTKVWSPGTNAEEREYDLFSSLKDFGVLDFKAGIPNSLRKTGQQWDFPNAWPPSTHMIIMGLAQSTNPDLVDAGNELAANWLKANYELFKGI